MDSSNDMTNADYTEYVSVWGNRFLHWYSWCSTTVLHQKGINWPTETYVRVPSAQLSLLSINNEEIGHMLTIIEIQRHVHREYSCDEALMSQ